MADEEDSISSASSLAEPSPEALAALDAFRKENWNDYRTHHSLLIHLIHLLTDRLELTAGSEFLPADVESETADEKGLRCLIVDRLINEVCRIGHGTPVFEPDYYGYDYYNVFVDVFYWHLSRQSRLPSNLGALKSINTRTAGAHKGQRYNEWAEKQSNTQVKRTSLMETQRIMRQGTETSKYTSTESLASDVHADQGPTIRSTGNKKAQGRRDEYLGEPEEVSLQLAGFGPVDHIHLLDYLIDTVRRNFKERYGQTLLAYQSNDLHAELTRGLAQGVQDLSRLGKFDLER